MQQIKIEPIELLFAKSISQKEMAYRKKHNIPEKPFFARMAPPERLVAMTRGKICEIAVSKFTGLSHNYQIGVQSPDQFDVGNIIEVKCKFSERENFSISEWLTKKQKALVGCVAEFDNEEETDDDLRTATVTIHGWVWTKEVPLLGTRKVGDDGKPYYIMPLDKFGDERWNELLEENFNLSLKNGPKKATNKKSLAKKKEKDPFDWA